MPLTGGTIRYDYDKNDNITKVTGWDGEDAKDNYQIIGTKRTFEYDDDGKLLKATEVEDRQGSYVYNYQYDDMGNRTSSI